MRSPSPSSSRKRPGLQQPHQKSRTLRTPSASTPTPTPQRVPAAVALSDDDGAADTATLSQAEPVLTETMAELYLKQGHQQDALRVYQSLLAQRPTDAKLRSKVEQLSPGGKKKRSGVSAQAFLKGIWSGRGSQSTLAAAFDAAGPPPGEPSRPAQDHISLDSVFGDDAARRTGPERAEAPPAPPTAPADGSKTGGFSFDEFFAGGKPGAAGSVGGGGGGGGGGGPAGETASPRTPGGSRPSGWTQRQPEDEVEADQFQQWLKKLKS